MSEQNSSEKITKEEWIRRYDERFKTQGEYPGEYSVDTGVDYEEVSKGFEDDPEGDFYVYFRNQELKTYLRLSNDAGFALLASLESAAEYRRTKAKITNLAFKVMIDSADVEKLPEGIKWQLVTEGK